MILNNFIPSRRENLLNKFEFGFLILLAESVLFWRLFREDKKTINYTNWVFYTDYKINSIVIEDKFKGFFFET